MKMDVQVRREAARKILAFQRPGFLPMDVFGYIEYRKDVYHLGEPELRVQPGEVGTSRDGSRRYTHDGGVWNVGAAERYPDHEAVLAVDLDRFPVEEPGPAMREEMLTLYREKERTHVPVPWHYGTLVSRATIEFGWEPFLTASALDPLRFGRILDRFGEASLAVIRGWAGIREVPFIVVHDDIAGTRGLILDPRWLAKHVFPWYRRFFDAVHSLGGRVLYISDGNYLDALPQILDAGPDGLYCESSSMDPAELLPRCGRDKLYMVKTDSRTMDQGTPGQIRGELIKLRGLHREYPGMFIYSGGGNVNPANEAAFRSLYDELLVYGEGQ
jgi:hypothetical protein